MAFSVRSKFDDMISNSRRISFCSSEISSLVAVRLQPLISTPIMRTMSERKSSQVWTRVSFGLSGMVCCVSFSRLRDGGVWANYCEFHFVFAACGVAVCSEGERLCEFGGRGYFGVREAH